MLGVDFGFHMAPHEIKSAEHTLTPTPTPISLLTRREGDVLKLVLQARSDKEIANDLGISRHTVKSHVSSILRKCKVRTRMELACIVLARAPHIDLGPKF